MNHPLIKMCDIQEQQLRHISDSQILIQRIQEQLNDIISQLQESNTKQATSFGEFFKGSEQQMNQQNKITIYYINYENNQIIRKRKSVGINLRFIFYTHDDLSFSFHRIHGKYYFETKKDNRNCPNL